MRNKLLLGAGLISLWHCLPFYLGIPLLILGFYLILNQARDKPNTIPTPLSVREIEKIKINLDKYKDVFQ